MFWKENGEFQTNVFKSINNSESSLPSGAMEFALTPSTNDQLGTVEGQTDNPVYKLSQP